MVKVYHPPSQKFSELIKVVPEEKIVTPARIRPKREVDTHIDRNAAYVKPTFPSGCLSELAPEGESTREQTKTFCMLPPSMQRQQVVQKSRKWGLVPPSLVRQSRGDRHGRGRKVDNDDELREDSANVDWLFDVRAHASKDSQPGEQRNQLVAETTPRWLSRLIRVPIALTSKDIAAANKREETSEVDFRESCSSWLSKLNVGLESDVHAFSILHQLMDDGTTYFEKAFPASTSSLPSAMDSSQGSQQKASFVALSKWLSNQQNGKIVVELPTIKNPFHQSGRDGKMTHENISWFKRWIEARDLDNSRNSSDKNGDEGSRGAPAQQLRAANAPSNPATRASNEKTGSIERASNAKDTTKMWLSKWVKPEGESKHSSIDMGVKDQDTFVPEALPPALSKTLFQTFPTNDVASGDIFESDLFSWVDRIMLPVEFILPISANEPYEPIDNDYDDDVELEDDEDDDDYFSYRRKDGFYVKIAVQDNKLEREDKGDDPIVTSTVKRVRFNLGDNEHRWHD